MFRWVIYKSKNSKNFTIVILLSIISFFINAITPYLNGILFNMLTSNANKETIVRVAIIVAIFGIGNSIFTYILLQIITVLKADTFILLLKSKIKGLYEIPFGILENIELSGLSQQIYSDIQVVSDFVLTNFIKIILNGILLLVAIFMMYALNSILFLIGIILSIIYFTVIFFLKVPISKRLTDKKQSDVVFYQKYSSQVLLSGLLYISSNIENSINYLINSFAPLKESIKQLARIQSIYLSSNSIISAFYQALLFVIGGIQIINKELTLGDFITLNLYFNLIINIIKYYINYYNSYIDAQVSYNRLKKLTEFKNNKKHDVLKFEHLNSICIEDMSFSYQSSNGLVDVINNLSTTFDRNKIYVVQGANGSGKTTLLKIILGLYEGTLVNLKYNNEDARNVDTFHIRNQCVSYLPQSFFKPDMSVEEFLLLMSFNEQSDKHSLIDIERVFKIPYSECQKLSGGELKKLYLKIVLSKESDFLILDEPTNDLDENSKRELIRYLQINPKKQGVIISTHDSDLLKVADEVFYL